VKYRANSRSNVRERGVKIMSLSGQEHFQLVAPGRMGGDQICSVAQIVNICRTSWAPHL